MMIDGDDQPMTDLRCDGREQRLNNVTVRGWEGSVNYEFSIDGAGVWFGPG